MSEEAPHLDGAEDRNADILVRHNSDRQRYELVDAGASGDPVIGSAHYRPYGDESRIFFHTVVDDEYSGRGLAGTLAAFALRETVEAGQRIIPVCPYIKVYVGKHRDEFGDHVDPVRQEHVDAVQDGRPRP
ncbi:GNAT family N-acetyltransferase [Zhihengliuella sp.]|uniref:GNAT family N-acetyltransferase n=1 Tax=Zhihengliuella sp. TaxID=1954483 RepID=UPI0028112108|nr:GNAT family N-acetyltransferase [Zhihengliuella sp.]